MSPRLPMVTAKQLVAALKKAGFEEHTQQGSHLTLRKKSPKRRTTVPMHARDIGRGLLKRILAQAGLTDGQFRDLL